MLLLFYFVDVLRGYFEFFSGPRSEIFLFNSPNLSLEKLKKDSIGIILTSTVSIERKLYREVF